MAAPKTSIFKLAAALAMLALAVGLVLRFLRGQEGVSEKAFYYDLSEQKLFVARRGLIPPIQGVNDAVPDGVRAVVISTNAQPANRATWKIAYLEMYSPELKQQMEAAKSAGTSPAMGRTAAQAHRLVKRVADQDWVTLVSPEGERIVSEWATPGADGMSPVVCSPGPRD